MRPDLLLGIDAGTSVIKTVAFSLAGEQVAAHAVENRYQIIPGGGAEQDMARTWADTAVTLRGLAEKVPDLARRALAVGITGQGDGTWLIDAAGEPVAPAWLWLDARSAPIIEKLRADPRAEMHYRHTATGLAPCQQGGQLLWLAARRPDLLAAATTAFHCKDWLYFKLTGIRATDPAEGMFTFGDYRTLAYCDEVLEFLGLADYRRLLPPILDGTRHADRLSPEAARSTGLLSGTPIILGYLDVPCTALGAGLCDQEDAVGCTIVGSTGMHMRFVPNAEGIVLNAERTGYTMPLPMPGTYAQMQSNLACTLNIDWLLDLARDVLSATGHPRSRSELLAGMDEKVLAAAAAEVLFQPYISEAGERGPFIDAGARAGFIGLTTRHGYADLMRAVYEGLAFAMRDCYATMGAPPKEVRLTGGAARSRALRAIMAATLGAGIRVSAREEAGAAGAAMMASVCCNVYPHMESCTRDWVRPLLGPLEMPDAALTNTYARRFPQYVEARRALAPTWRALGERVAVA